MCGQCARWKEPPVPAVCPLWRCQAQVDAVGKYCPVPIHLIRGSMKQTQGYIYKRIVLMASVMKTKHTGKVKPLFEKEVQCRIKWDSECLLVSVNVSQPKGNTIDLCTSQSVSINKLALVLLRCPWARTWTPISSVIMKGWRHQPSI